jgi:predicted lipoprotein with Yx(FWY)xxD motif
MSGAIAAPMSALAAGKVAPGKVAAGKVAARTAGAQPAASAAASAAHVDLRSTALGKVLVNGSGFTLYVFGRDSRDKDRCVAISGCTGAWPPLTTHGRAVAGRGVQASWLGTIELPGGTRQVTYDGHPLYTYAFDSGPGQTDYVGASAFGGVWRALTASGKTVS